MTKRYKHEDEAINPYLIHVCSCWKKHWMDKISETRLGMCDEAATCYTNVSLKCHKSQHADFIELKSSAGFSLLSSVDLSITPKETPTVDSLRRPPHDVRSGSVR